MLPDNWIYVQEPDVRLGRLQIFNNWSPYLVPDPTKVWLGLEYSVTRATISGACRTRTWRAAVRELERIGIVDPADVVDRDGHPRAEGLSGLFRLLRRFARSAPTSTDPNLFLLGRNGMHRYNNQDHSMLTAMAAVDASPPAAPTRRAIWDINVDDEYHEQKGP